MAKEIQFTCESCSSTWLASDYGDIITGELKECDKADEYFNGSSCPECGSTNISGEDQ